MLAQRSLRQSDHGRLANAPSPGHSDRDRTPIGLHDYLGDSVRDTIKVEEIAIGLIVWPHNRQCLPSTWLKVTPREFFTVRELFAVPVNAAEIDRWTFVIPEVPYRNRPIGQLLCFVQLVP